MDGISYNDNAGHNYYMQIRPKGSDHVGDATNKHESGSNNNRAFRTQRDEHSEPTVDIPDVLREYSKLYPDNLGKGLKPDNIARARALSQYATQLSLTASDSDTEEEDDIEDEEGEGYEPYHQYLNDMETLVDYFIRGNLHQDGVTWRSRSWLMQKGSETLKLQAKSFFNTLQKSPGTRNGWIETARCCYIAPCDSAQVEVPCARPDDFYPPWFIPEVAEDYYPGLKFIAGQVKGLHGLDGFGIARLHAKKNSTRSMLDICCYPHFTFHRWNFSDMPCVPELFDNPEILFPQTLGGQVIKAYLSNLHTRQDSETERTNLLPSKLESKAQPVPNTNGTDDENKHIPSSPSDRLSSRSEGPVIPSQRLPSDADTIISPLKILMEELMGVATLQELLIGGQTDSTTSPAPKLSKAEKKREAQRQRRSRKRAENSARKQPDSLSTTIKRDFDDADSYLVDIVVQQAGVSREAAFAALKQQNGDVVDAIMALIS